MPTIDKLEYDYGLSQNSGFLLICTHPEVVTFFSANIVLSCAEIILTGHRAPLTLKDLLFIYLFIFFPV